LLLQELYERQQELRTLISTSHRDSTEVEAQKNHLALQMNETQGKIGQVLSK
jgi:hypothetical protein